MTPLAQEWVEAADEDLQAARLLLDHGGPNTTVCFHTQQAAEKLLKAFLQENGVAPPHTHDLESLQSRCQALDPSLAALLPVVQELTTYYMNTRYPPGIVPRTGQQARNSFLRAEEVHQAIMNLLAPPQP